MFLYNQFANYISNFYNFLFMQEQVQSNQSKSNKLRINNQNLQISIFQQDQNALSDSFIHHQGGFSLHCSFDQKNIYIILIHDEDSNCEGVYYFKKSKRNQRKIKQLFWMKRLAHLEQLKLSQGLIIAIQTNMTYKLYLKRQEFQACQKNIQPVLEVFYNIYKQKNQKMMSSKLMMLLLSQTLKSSLLIFVQQNAGQIKQQYLNQKYQQEKNLTKCAVCLEVLPFQLQKKQQLQTLQENIHFWNYLTKKILSHQIKPKSLNSTQNSSNFKQVLILQLNNQKNSNSQKNINQQQENNLKYLICSHVFHKQCIQKWLQIKNYCPVCKTRQSKTQNRKRHQYYQDQDFQNQFDLFNIEFIDHYDWNIDQNLFIQDDNYIDFIRNDDDIRLIINDNQQASSLTIQFQQQLSPVVQLNFQRPLTNNRQTNIANQSINESIMLQGQQEDFRLRNKNSRIKLHKQQRKKGITKYQSSNRRNLRSHDRKNFQTSSNTNSSPNIIKRNDKKKLKKKKISKNFVNKRRQIQKRALDFKTESIKDQSKRKSRYYLDIKNQKTKIQK